MSVTFELVIEIALALLTTISTPPTSRSLIEGGADLRFVLNVDRQRQRLAAGPLDLLRGE